MVNSAEILRTFREFYMIKDVGDAIVTSIVRLAELLDIDRVSMSLRHDVENQFVNLIDYRYAQENDISNTMNILSKFTNLYMNNHELNKIEDNLISVFGDGACCITEDFPKIADAFHDVGYETNVDNVLAFATHYIKIDYNFIYVTFEKQKVREHNNEVVTKCFTTEEGEYLNTFCEMLQIRLEREEYSKIITSERKMIDSILVTENMPIAMIERNTYKIISYNDMYNQVLPNIKRDKICYELKGETRPCSHCCLVEDQVEENSTQKGKYWIKKSIDFTLANGVDVHLVYAKETTDFIKQLEDIDMLTSLFSLKGLTKYYKRAIQPSKHNYAVATLDIDKFKYLNSTYGYEFGDEILKYTAIIIRDSLKEDEMSCRLTEDKFALILRFDSIESLYKKLKYLKYDLKIMREELFSDKRVNYTGGITLLNRDLELSEMIDQANIARKSIKEIRTHEFALYNNSFAEKISKEIMIEDRLYFAIQENEFVAYLQPKFDLFTMQICGAEALVRWITPEGMIFPDEFIPLFERNGFIRELDFIIYEQVMRQIRKWIFAGKKVYPVSLNVSRNHIQDERFLIKLKDLVRIYDVPIELLELEVTESMFIEDTSTLKEFIDSLKKEGFTVSIDDFGTAYSSLHILKDINIDILKIDKGFLDELHYRHQTTSISKDEIVIKNIINMAKELGFKVICEGVETMDQITVLKNIGCELGQGYVFAKPMTMTEFEGKYL